jgi:selenocysteine lyase/cysteine desulfurase
MSLADIREDFSALSHGVHLNTGGMAPLPKSVAAELLRIPQHMAEYGPALLLAHDETLTRAEAAQQPVARFLGADADEIAFTTQFSTGVNLIVEGMAWLPGDEIIVTDQEHPARLTPILNIARRKGLRERRLELTPVPSDLLAEFDTLLNERTRLVAVSHVTTETGFRLPVGEMAARARDCGALMLVHGVEYGGGHSPTTRRWPPAATRSSGMRRISRAICMRHSREFPRREYGVREIRPKRQGS